MRKALLFSFLAFVFSAPVFGQVVRIPGPGGATGASNTQLLNSTACNNGATNAPYACSVPSTTSGSLLVILEEDADDPAAPSVFPSCSGIGATVSEDGTFADGAGRMTVFSAPAINAGVSSCTITPTSGHSSVNIREYSGAASSSPLDTIVAANKSNSSSTFLSSSTITTSQTDIVISWCGTGATATASMASLDNWANGIDFPQPNDAGDWYAQDILNGLVSNFTGSETGDSHNYVCGAVAYKSAVAGSSTGNQPPNYWRADDGGTDTTVITSTNLTNAMHGQNVTATAGANGLTFSTTQSINPVTPVVVNGKKYTTSTTSFAYDLGQNGANASVIAIAPKAGTNNSFSWGCHLYFPEVSDPTNPFTIVGVVDGGTDRAEFAITNDNWTLEAAAADSSPQSLAGHLNQWIWITGLYNGTGTGVHRLRVYTCASSCMVQANWTELGTEATVAVTGSAGAAALDWGRLGAESGGTGFTQYLSGCQLDSINANYPLLP